jgi:hypothetical protein
MDDEVKLIDELFDLWDIIELNADHKEIGTQKLQAFLIKHDAEVERLARLDELRKYLEKELDLDVNILEIRYLNERIRQLTAEGKRD